jgi:magnesium chelatase family protein
MRKQVTAARRRQRRRFEGGKTRRNSQMSSRQIRSYCRLDRESLDLLKANMDELGLSARAHDKVLRVARTIADLEESEEIRAPHISEAINYRMLDRQMWT